MYPNSRCSVNFIDIVTAVYCGFCILELSSNSFKYICLFLLALWLVVASLSDRQAFDCMFNNRIWPVLCLFAVIYFVYVLFTRGMIYGLKYSLTMLISESPFFLFVYYENKRERSIFSDLLPWVEFIVILFLCANILRLIEIDPKAARTMAADTNIYDGYVTGGGYQIAYALCLLIPFLIFSFRMYHNKLMAAFFILAFSFTIIKCSYTLAILLAVFELFLLFYWAKNADSSNTAIVVFVFIVFSFLILLLREPIGDFFINRISPMFSGSFAERRMREFGEFIKGEAGKSNGASTRMSRYEQSIKTFFRSPLIGISYRSKFISYKEMSYIGRHSSIFDGFARFGFSFILYIVYYFRAIRYLKDRIRRSMAPIIGIVGIVFFAVKTLNVADAFGLGYIVYFAIPMLCKSYHFRSS